MRMSRAAILVSVFLTFLLMCSSAYCADDKVAAPKSEFEKIYAQTPSTNGVKVITYAQLVKIRGAAEKVVLVDVLSCDDYGTGHIAGAISFPVGMINKDSASKKIPKGSNVIVYCLGSACHLSVDASRKLESYGYKVLDYKGGLDEWQEKGNKLVR